MSNDHIPPRVRTSRREVDPSEYPVCRVCGKPIPKEVDDTWKWFRRLTCRKKDSDTCWRIFTKTTRERLNGPKSNPHRKKKPEPSRIRPSGESHPLDLMQQELNKQIDRTIADRNGYGQGSVKIYSKSEIALMNSQRSV